MTDKPLKGIRVCDYGQHGAGSACGKVLADWGAEVIKVEPLWGCPSRFSGAAVGLCTAPDGNAHFEMINSGKKSVAVNLKTSDGLAIIDKLISTSHMFFSNYRLQALKNFGLDYETLSAKYPRLIWGHLNGYGTEGPMRGEPGFDNVSYWAYSGLTSDPAHPEQMPGRSAFGGGDMMTGYVLASSMAACLYQQAVRGKGQAVYTSLYGTGCWQDSCLIQAAADHDMQSAKPGALDGYMRCKDAWFILGIMDYPKIGPRVAHMIGRDDLAEVFSSRESLVAHYEECRTLTDGFFAGYAWEELDRILTGIDIVHCRAQQPGEVARDVQARENGYVWDHTLRNGKTVAMVSTPVKFGRQEPIVTTHAPLVGEHTKSVLMSLGYTEAAIADMAANGTVKATDVAAD